MGFHGRAATLRLPCATPSLGCSGVKRPAIGLWSSGNTFSGVMNQASGSPMARMHSDNFKRNNGRVLFFMVRPLVPVKGNRNATAYNDILGQWFPNFS